MKSKMKFALVALVLPLFALIFGLQASAETSKTKAETVQIPNNAVAMFVGGVPQALNNRLVMQLVGGGAVTAVEFSQSANNWWMVRRGVQNGNYRTEKFTVDISNGFLLYRPVIFHVCVSPDCHTCEYHVIEGLCHCRANGPENCQNTVIGPIVLGSVITV